LITGGSGNYLDEDEFEIAFKYIHSKSIIITLNKLGVSKEDMILVALIMTVFLILIFVFIFLGIAACNYFILN